MQVQVVAMAIGFDECQQQRKDQASCFPCSCQKAAPLHIRKIQKEKPKNFTH
jgi:hypothetical protein